MSSLETRVGQPLCQMFELKKCQTGYLFSEKNLVILDIVGIWISEFSTSPEFMSRPLDSDVFGTDSIWFQVFWFSLKVMNYHLNTRHSGNGLKTVPKFKLGPLYWFNCRHTSSDYRNECFYVLYFIDTKTRNVIGLNTLQI